MATTRALSLLVGTAAAGGLIWVAAQVHRDTTGGYWAQLGILAGAGLAMALTRLPGRGARVFPPSLPPLVLAFLPALVASGWIAIAAQPHGNTWRRHVLEWSHDIGVTRVVDDLGPLVIVLAFGLGALLGLVLESRSRAREMAVPVADESVRTSEPAPIDAAVDDERVVGDHELVHR